MSCAAASGVSLHFYANTTSWFTFNYWAMSGRQASGWDCKGNPSRTEQRHDWRDGTEVAEMAGDFLNFSGFEVSVLIPSRFSHFLTE